MKSHLKSKTVIGIMGVVASSTFIPDLYNGTIKDMLSPELQGLIPMLWKYVVAYFAGQTAYGIRVGKEPLGKQEKLNQVNLKGYDSEI